MHVTDVPDPGRISRRPDGVVTILERPYTLQGSTIHRMELRLYAEGSPGRLYSIITAYLEMDGHSIETIYDEGHRGDTPLQDAARFLMSSVGPSGAILRARLALEAALDRPGKV
ncbi:MAG: hypothetical protein J4G04_03460 [Nitrosopumilaceae archaeon]|nr:hypothetical protein [Nitrosopumilaceae archaeon]